MSREHQYKKPRSLATDFRVWTSIFNDLNLKEHERLVCVDKEGYLGSQAEDLSIMMKNRIADNFCVTDLCAINTVNLSEYFYKKFILT